MTCIVVVRDKNKLLFGAETRGTVDTQYMDTFKTKLIKHKKLIVAIAGTLGTAEYICNFIIKKIRTFPAKSSIATYKWVHSTIIVPIRQAIEAGEIANSLCSVTFLLGINNQLFVVYLDNADETPDVALETVEPPFSIGCGQMYALGALHVFPYITQNITPSEQVTLAIQSAIDNDCSCGGKIILVKED